MNIRLSEFLRKVGLTQQDFNRSVNFYSRDNVKLMYMMQMQKMCGYDKSTPPLPRETIMSSYKALQEIKLAQLRKMKEQKGFSTPQSTVETMRRALVEDAKAADMLFKDTGVEEEHLLFSIEHLQMEKGDEEFAKM